MLVICSMFSSSSRADSAAIITCSSEAFCLDFCGCLCYFLDNAGDMDGDTHGSAPIYIFMHGAGHGAYKQACWGKNDGLQHPYKVGLMQTDRGSWLFSSVSLLASSASATSKRAVRPGASHGNIHFSNSSVVAWPATLYSTMADYNGSAVHSCSLIQTRRRYPSPPSSTLPCRPRVSPCSSTPLPSSVNPCDASSRTDP